jgi:hypothetical protein
MGVITPERYIMLVSKTPVILHALLNGISQEQAMHLTDGPGGWSVVETMCHIRDFGDVCLERARRILSEDAPALANLNPTEKAIERDYPDQNLAAELVAFDESRRMLIALLNNVSGDQWERYGIHAKFGPMTMLDMVVFIVGHDVDHTEQIARTLQLAEPLI